MLDAGPGVEVLDQATAALINSIRKGEVELLVRIPGVGKKTAERMVLELRDKLAAPAGQASDPPVPALSAVDQRTQTAKPLPRAYP